MTLSPEEIDRYARHIVLREIGGPGQQKLSKARVLVVGAGGLGSPALLYLAAAGIGNIVVVDDDAVSLSNLQRQVLFRTSDIGKLKAQTAERTLLDVNPHLSVTGVLDRLDHRNAASIVSNADIVLDGCDNFETRYLVNEACVDQAKPLISGAMSQWEGQIALFDPQHGGPCYACVFPEAPAPGLVPSCAEAGIIGALPGVMGSMMALEAVKFVTGAGTGLRSALLIYDALHAETRRVRISARRDCGVCGGRGVEGVQPADAR